MLKRIQIKGYLSFRVFYEVVKSDPVYVHRLSYRLLCACFPLESKNIILDINFLMLYTY